MKVFTSLNSIFRLLSRKYIIPIIQNWASLYRDVCQLEDYMPIESFGNLFGLTWET